MIRNCCFGDFWLRLIGCFVGLSDCFLLMLFIWCIFWRILLWIYRIRLWLFLFGILIMFGWWWWRNDVFIVWILIIVVGLKFVGKFGFFLVYLVFLELFRNLVLFDLKVMWLRLWRVLNIFWWSYKVRCFLKYLLR